SDQARQPVGPRLGDELVGQHALRAGLALDDHRLAGEPRELVAVEAHDEVGAGAGGVVAAGADPSRRVILRRRALEPRRQRQRRGWNLARESTQSAGLAPQTPAYDVQRACGTSLTAVSTLAGRIALGEIDSAIAGGSDSASDIPISCGRNLQRIVLASARGRSFLEKTRPWLQLRPKDFKPSIPGVAEMRTGLSMGEHCELMAKEWGIGRAEQDELALASHKKAAEAWRGGF